MGSTTRTQQSTICLERGESYFQLFNLVNLRVVYIRGVNGWVSKDVRNSNNELRVSFQILLLLADLDRLCDFVLV
jgi:hypothetical protein